MIVQISLVRNELPLIKKLLPIWKTYTDGFVFMLDTNTDETEEYLKKVSYEYNILEILKHEKIDNVLEIETDIRQELLNAGLKYTNKIICLDADEYLDGVITKKELESILDSNTDVRFYLKWNQYTSCNTIRTDGPWKDNYKDRIAVYSKNVYYDKKQNHSDHLPYAGSDRLIDSDKLFIAHLQWVSKKYVAIKQYYWKIYDYVNNLKFGVGVVGNTAYDSSVNNFDWEEEYIFYPLKLSTHIFEKDLMLKNYRLDYIKENTKKYNIPNLGDWGMDITNIDTNEIPNKYKVSVITAIGDILIYGKYIDRYIKNVTNQHLFLETEHIIVYSEWSSEFEKFNQYENFILVKENEKLGVYNAWNIGIKNATTKYVTNWNIDDIRHPINTKIKYDLLERNEYDVAYNYYTATKDDTIDFYNIQNTPHLKYPDNYENHVLENCYAGPDPMWKINLHDKVGYFDYINFNTIGDWEMWIRFARAGAKFKLISEVLCIYLDHNDTVSKKQQDKVYSEKIRLFEKYYKK
jgi:hypothetical protein